MSKRKLKKSVLLPMALFLYALAMTLYFGPSLLDEGLGLKLWISIGCELLVIVGLYFALRRKERLSKYWEHNEKDKN